MTIYNRPDEKVFASGARPGEVVAFPDIERGWGLAFEQTEGKPPMEWMNGLFQVMSEAVRYFMQRGLSEWSATEDYPVGAFVQHGGKAYRALQENSNVTPGTAASTWGELAPNASTTVRGLIEIATVTEAKELVDKLRAITPETLGAVLSEFRQNLVPSATFAEISALTEDQGPLICNDNHAILYLWDGETEAYKPVSATESKAGTVKISTTEQAQALTDDTRAITPKKLGDAMNAHVLGMGQAWVDVRSQRLADTTYTNTTGRTIAISAYGFGPDRFSLTIGGVKIGTYRGVEPSGENTDGGVFGIVPPGATYRIDVTGGAIRGWVELR